MPQGSGKPVPNVEINLEYLPEQGVDLLEIFKIRFEKKHEPPQRSLITQKRSKRNHMHPVIPKPFLVPQGSGKVLKSIGVTHKLINQQTGGSYYLFIAEFDPESGNRLHVHTYEDEVVYVLQGAIQIRLGDSQLEASAGGVAHLPKGIPHGLYNPLKTPLRLLALAIPGGMEKFFDELEAAIQNGSMDDAKHREISRKYGIEWLE